MSDKNQPIGVGLIGCGYQGQWLARAAAAVDDYHLVACIDPDDQATAAVTDIAAHIRVEETVAALLAGDDVDVVFIATPHHLLQPFALQAAAAGKHILAEKPIALNAQQALELETAVARNKVQYLAGYSFRYFPPIAQAKQLIAQGVIGEIQTISAGMPKPGLRPGWVANADTGGGILGFYGCHMIDRVLWFVDDKPVQVSATVINHPDYGVDQTSIFQIWFERGVIAQFNICGSAAGWFDFAHVCGRDGHLYLASAKFPNYALTLSSTVREEYAVPQTTTMALDRATAVQQKMEAELIDFTQAIRGICAPAITVADGRQVLQIMDAIAKSAISGQPVSLA